MKYMLVFHKFMFVFMLVLSFFAGALHAGRAKALERKEIQLLLMMDLEQLTEVKLDV